MDLWAVLMAGILQNNGEYEFNVAAINHYICNVKRGVEIKQVNFPQPFFNPMVFEFNCEFLFIWFRPLFLLST